MNVELLDYAIENEGSLQAWANLFLMVDGVGPIRWHVLPDMSNAAEDRVAFSSGIGAPGDDYDVSTLSPDDRSILLGERYGNEEILEFEEKVESAIRQQIQSIRSELREVLMTAFDHQFGEDLI